MFKYFLKRLAQMLVTLFIVSILVFVLANFIGDPVNMLVSPKAPPEVREQVREELGLNRPILEQYVSFVTNAFKGDFGKSYIYKVDVLSLIAQRVPATLELVFVSVVLALVISIPLGVYAGAFPKRKSSTVVMGRHPSDVFLRAEAALVPLLGTGRDRAVSGDEFQPVCARWT